MNVAQVVLVASLLAACEGQPKQQTPTPPVASSAAAAAGGPSVATAGGPAAVVDCGDTEHDGHAHPPSPPPQVATATALSAEAREKLTTLRVMAHVGAVIVRKEHGAWVVSGPGGCRVSPARVERALDNLADLKSEPTTDRPRDGAAFELQVVAQIGQERALHFDMAGRVAGRDLVQLGDYSTYWISGFDRELWAADARAWCTAR